MGSGVLCLIFLCGIIGAYTTVPQCSLITPNVLRMDSEETIIVDGHGSAFDANIIIQDFPQKKLHLVQGRVSVNNGNGFLGTVKMTVPSNILKRDPDKKQFVYVTVRSPSCNLEKVVLVSFQSGYVFIQTDKPIYTPGSTVLYRIFTMNPNLQPMSKSVSIEFLTPQNVIVKKELVRQVNQTGIMSLSYPLSEFASLGVWSISAKLDTDVQNYTANFEVKEYVLPSFEIKLEAAQKFFYIKDQELKVKISANYLYGKPVNGWAFTLFGVKRDNEKKSLTDSLRRVQIDKGEGEAVLQKQDLVKSIRKEADMLLWRLYVTVTVITDTGSDIVEAELDDIYIVTSPYQIHFTKTSKYFKPGIPFAFMVFVTNPDGSPANGIPVVVEPGTRRGTTQEDGTVRLTINTLSDINSLQVKVMTEDPKLANRDQQASASMTASAYRSSGGNFLHIGVTAQVLKPGNNVIVSFNIWNKDPAVQDQIGHFNYVILNKGRIMKVGRQERAPGQSPVNMVLIITGEFIPSFRIVGYYTLKTDAGHEIVADSIWVDVTDTCLGTLQVTGDKKDDNAVQSPGTTMNLKLTADHKASVGLVAVDKGVYVLSSKFKISQRKVWDSVEKYDIGCTPGSGADAPGVFYDAGLALQTSFQMTTPQRSEPLCEAKLKRRRRSSAAFIHHKDTKASQYTGQEKTCCQDGMLVNPMGHSCERRSRLIQEGRNCIAAFLDCCKHIEKLKASDRDQKEHDELERSDDASDYIDDSAIVTRSHFPESWLWKIETMTEKPDDKGISNKIFSVHLKESITTWEVLAVSLSESKGICVSQPYEIRVMKNFFIDLKLPYSVVRNEQVEIRAILYNYGNSNMKVHVEWTYNEEFCSLSTAKKKHHQEVTIRPESSVAVPFIIMPLTLGYHDVEVKAAGQLGSDGVLKQLKVVPEGKSITRSLISVTLDPVGKGRAGVQEEKIPAVDATYIVPNTNIETIVTIQGNPISEMVGKSIDGINLNHLISAPGGCGEQNMMKMTPTVIATHYLDTTDQWHRVGVQRRQLAIQYIKDGLDNQMTYRKVDSSYSIWKDTPASTWLTAYVAKVFALAANLIHVERDVMCDSVKWLIQNKQKPDGFFQEDAPVYSQKMVGGIKTGATELQSTLTAFVLISLVENENLCAPRIASLQGNMDKALMYINKQYPSLRKPYSIAITSYALARAGKLQDTRRLWSASTENTHWEEPDSHHLSLEATSYALLTLLKMKQFVQAGPVAQWLTEQRFHGEVYGSTQATIMLFQALARYQIDVPPVKDLGLKISFQLPGKSEKTTFDFTGNNAMLPRSDQTSVSGDFVVSARGKGRATLTIFSVYYGIKTEEEKKCNNFYLAVTVTDEPLAKRPEGSKSAVSLNICTRFLGAQDASMSILEISMLTGYAPDNSDLNKLKDRVDRYITNYEMNKGAFDRGTLILYLNKISRTEEECIKFPLYQYFEVELIQPASVTVYEYYFPENRCSKFYHLDDNSKHLGKICQGAACRCVQGHCFMQQQLDKVDANVRLKKACDLSVDYVFKTKLTTIDHRDGYDIYGMTINKVIKEGLDIEPQNLKRSFISHARCQKALQLQEGREYLIWGVSKDLWDTASGCLYMITKNTWIEMWPNNAECRNPGKKQLCDDISAFLEDYEDGYCSQ